MEELDNQRRARCLEVLRKPTDERSDEDLEILRGWASKILFRDAEVERKIDGLALCKSMRYQKTAKDEIIISHPKHWREQQCSVVVV